MCKPTPRSWSGWPRFNSRHRRMPVFASTVGDAVYADSVHWRLKLSHRPQPSVLPGGPASGLRRFSLTMMRLASTPARSIRSATSSPSLWKKVSTCATVKKRTPQLSCVGTTTTTGIQLALRSKAKPEATGKGKLKARQRQYLCADRLALLVHDQWARVQPACTEVQHLAMLAVLLAESFKRYTDMRHAANTQSPSEAPPRRAAARQRRRTSEAGPPFLCPGLSARDEGSGLLQAACAPTSLASSRCHAREIGCGTDRWVCPPSSPCEPAACSDQCRRWRYSLWPLRCQREALPPLPPGQRSL